MPLNTWTQKSSQMARQLYRIYSLDNKFSFEVGVPKPTSTDEQEHEAFRAEEKKGSASYSIMSSLSRSV